MGGNIGEIVFVNLRTGSCLGSTCVECSIKYLEILNESCSNTVWLIVSILLFLNSIKFCFQLQHYINVLYR